jgi:uncharacterized protein (TIGR03067 family)
MKLFITLLVVAVLCVIGDAPQSDKGNPFQGAWTLVDGEANAQLMTEAQLQPSKLSIDGEHYTIQLPGNGIITGTQTFDPSKSPMTIDIMDATGIHGGKTCLGIYEFDDTDGFRVVFAKAGLPRPTTFVTTPDSGQWMHVWRRVN